MKTAGAIFRWILLAVMSLVLAGAFYLLVILGQPQDTPEQAVQIQEHQPLVQPLPALQTTDETALAADFPAPVMLLGTQDALLVSGVRYDAAFEDGFGRLATLEYRLPDGTAVTVTSIYPARAMALADKSGFTLTADMDGVLAGYRAMRLESEDFIRLCAQGEEAVYVLTMPKGADTRLADLTKDLYLKESAE